MNDDDSVLALTVYMVLGIALFAAVVWFIVWGYDTMIEVPTSTLPPR